VQQIGNREMLLDEFHPEEFYAEQLSNLYFNLDLIFLTTKQLYMKTNKNGVLRASRG
jgi:hypothetical protein